MSLFWSNETWGATRFYNAALVGNLADSWNATVVRAAIAAHEGGDYQTHPENNLNRARAVIDGAIAKGVYVIVDWHSHQLLQADAQEFFSTLATEYADAPNVIWETFNEPPSTTYSWATLKPYHAAVIDSIRDAGSQNLVIVGSPNWSQDVDVASASPLADANVAYTLHFYANTHGQWLRDKANTALGRGAALFVTEYGTCNASGNGGFNERATREWFAWMDANQISSANWSMHDKVETASALAPGADSEGPWTADEVTASGFLVLEYVHGGFRNEVEITKAGAGTGTVTSTPAAIDCGATCSATFSAATQVTLTAAAAEGSTFTGWSGTCSGTGAECVIPMAEDAAATATFDVAPAP
jgi:endoglucanase